MKRLQLLGGVFSIILGTLLHFIYEWLGKSKIAAILGATNESTWEHLKLLALPIILFGIAEYFLYGNKIRNFIPVKTLSILLGMIIIIAVFYTYVGIIGDNFLWADISIFVLAVIGAYAFSAKFLNSSRFSSDFAILFGWLGLVFILAAFVIFTFFPPHIALFIDPATKLYGIFA